MKEVYLLFPMHPYSGYFLRFRAFGKVFPILGSLLGSLHSSAGLQTGHGSDSEFFFTVLDSALALSA